MTYFTKKDYYFGFDLIKLIGCCLIVLAHAYVFRLDSSTSLWVGFFGEVLPVFFIIAGFLMANSLAKSKNPARYLGKYVRKYTALFFAVEILTLIGHYLKEWIVTRTFSVSGFFSDLAKSLFLLPFTLKGFAPQLWFLLPLIAGVGIWGGLRLKKKEKIAVPILLSVTGILILLTSASEYLPQLFPTLHNSETFFAVCSVSMKYIEGILFVWIGMHLFDHYESFMNGKAYWKVLALTCILTLLDSWLYYTHSHSLYSIQAFPISLILRSTVLMKPIFLIPFDGMKKWRKVITIFTGLMYFMHLWEISVLRIFIRNSILIVPLVILINVLLTWLLRRLTRRKKNRGDPPGQKPEDPIPVGAEHSEA